MNRIQAITRAAQLLDLFGLDRIELSLSDMAADLELSKATVHRYATTLRETRLLQHDQRTSRYRLGPRIIEMASVALEGLEIVPISAPYLTKLSGEFRETAILTVWGGEAPLVVAVEEDSRNLISIRVRVGARLPVPRSAHGRLYLAFLDPPSSARCLSMEERSDLLERRVATSAEVVSGLRGIATPVFQAGVMAGAIGLVGSAPNISSEADAPMAKRLIEVGKTLSKELG